MQSDSCLSSEACKAKDNRKSAIQKVSDTSILEGIRRRRAMARLAAGIHEKDELGGDGWSASVAAHSIG